LNYIDDTALGKKYDRIKIKKEVNMENFIKENEKPFRFSGLE